jgi:predicted dehydrogenase
MNKMRWGLIGAGDIVRKRIVPALAESKLCELVAVCRGNAAKAEEFAREFDIPAWYSDHREMLSAGDIDAVYIASPVYLHAEHTKDAARAGKHVLCEKPLALDTAECDEMIAACKENGVTLGVAYYRRFYPVVERIRKALRDGEIGKAVFVQVNTFEAFNPGPDHPRRWFIEKAKSGGGPMMDFGCHRIEILLDLFGSVNSVESINANVIFDREVEDTSSALLRFESGPCASLTVTHAAKASLDSFDIYGTGGTIRIGSLNSGMISIENAAGNAAESHPPSSNFHSPLIEDFAESVMNGREPRVTGETGREVARILDAIYDR